MEGKSPALSIVMIGVLLIGLFIAQTQVEAKSCCKSTLSRNCYNICRIGGDVSRKNCAAACSCKIVEGTERPSSYHLDVSNFLSTDVDNEANSEDTYDNNEFCKLGCTSFACSNIVALHKSTGRLSELEQAVNEAAERCNNVCFQFCKKKADTELVMAI